MTPAEFRLIHRPVNEDEDDVRADFDADLEATLGHVVRQKDAEIARLREALVKVAGLPCGGEPHIVPCVSCIAGDALGPK